MDKGFVREIRAEPGTPAWRRGEDDRTYALDGRVEHLHEMLARIRGGGPDPCLPPPAHQNARGAHRDLLLALAAMNFRSGLFFRYHYTGNE